MKLNIEQPALLKALGHVLGVVERRNTIPILSNVLLEAAEGALKFTATDLDMEITDSAAASSQRPGRVTVPAALLHDIVRKLPQGAQVELDYGGDDPRMRVQAGRAKFNLPVLPPGDFPLFSFEGFTHKLELDADVLSGLIDKTRFAISSEETRYYLNGLYLHTVSVDGALKLRVVSTDGHRLALAEIDAPAGAEGMPSVIIPRKAVGEMRKLLDDAGENVKLDVGQQRFRLAAGDVVLRSKVIDGAFPDYVRVIPKDNQILMRLDSKLFAAAVDRVATISGDKSRSVKLALETGRLSLSVKNMEAGAGLEELEVGYAGSPLEIGFNARYVLDVCSQVDGEEVEFRFMDHASPALVVDPAVSNSRFVLMPLRV